MLYLSTQRIDKLYEPTAVCGSHVNKPVEVIPTPLGNLSFDVVAKTDHVGFQGAIVVES